MSSNPFSSFYDKKFDGAAVEAATGADEDFSSSYKRAFRPACAEDWEFIEPNFLSTGTELFEILQGGEEKYEALKKPSAKDPSLVLVPYRNVGTGQVVEPGDEWKANSLPCITEVVSKIAAGLPWTVPREALVPSMVRMKLLACARCDIRNGGSQEAVIEKLHSDLAAEADKWESKTNDDNDNGGDDTGGGENEDGGGTGVVDWERVKRQIASNVGRIEPGTEENSKALRSGDVYTSGGKILQKSSRDDNNNNNNNNNYSSGSSSDGDEDDDSDDDSDDEGDALHFNRQKLSPFSRRDEFSSTADQRAAGSGSGFARGGAGGGAAECEMTKRHPLGGGGGGGGAPGFSSDSFGGTTKKQSLFSNQNSTFGSKGGDGDGAYGNTATGAVSSGTGVAENGTSFDSSAYGSLRYDEKLLQSLLGEDCKVRSEFQKSANAAETSASRDTRRGQPVPEKSFKEIDQRTETNAISSAPERRESNNRATSVGGNCAGDGGVNRRNGSAPDVPKSSILKGIRIPTKDESFHRNLLRSLAAFDTIDVNDHVRTKKNANVHFTTEQCSPTNFSKPATTTTTSGPAAATTITTATTTCNEKERDIGDHFYANECSAGDGKVCIETDTWQPGYDAPTEYQNGACEETLIGYSKDLNARAYENDEKDETGEAGEPEMTVLEPTNVVVDSRGKIVRRLDLKIEGMTADEARIAQMQRENEEHIGGTPSSASGSSVGAGRRNADFCADECRDSRAALEPNKILNNGGRKYKNSDRTPNRSGAAKNHHVAGMENIPEQFRNAFETLNQPQPQPHARQSEVSENFYFSANSNGGQTTSDYPQDISEIAHLLRPFKRTQLPPSGATEAEVPAPFNANGNGGREERVAFVDSHHLGATGNGENVLNGRDVHAQNTQKDTHLCETCGYCVAGGGAGSGGSVGGGSVESGGSNKMSSTGGIDGKRVNALVNAVDGHKRIPDKVVAVSLGDVCALQQAITDQLRALSTLSERVNSVLHRSVERSDADQWAGFF